MTVISRTTAVTIGSGITNATRLMGVLIGSPLTGTCVISGFLDDAGVPQSYTLPVGSAGFRDFLGAINAAGPLIITCSNAADDNLVAVFWRPAA